MQAIEKPTSKASFATLTLIVVGLSFVWSITGTIALRHSLLVLMIAFLPFAGIDRSSCYATLRGSIALRLLGLLTAWIILHNLFFAWDTGRSWYESQQWFKSIICLGLGIVLMNTPSSKSTHQRLTWWIGCCAAAFALHLIFNLAIKPWSESVSLAATLQMKTPIGSRDMVSYSGTGLIAFLLADAVARAAGSRRLFPLGTKALLLLTFIAILLTFATLTRNALVIMALELCIAVVAYLGITSATHRRKKLWIAILAMGIVAAAAFANFKADPRWSKFSDSVAVAWDTDKVPYWMDQRAYPIPAGPTGVLVDHSAYLRVAWIKGSVELIAKYPLGAGYDRNAFRRILMRHYGLTNTASGHAHAGLFDFALAVGIPGVAMLLAAFCALLIFGWRSWRTSNEPAGLALTIFVASYAARSAIDGTVRDHMLEQAFFIIGLLLASTVAANRSVARKV